MHFCTFFFCFFFVVPVVYVEITENILFAVKFYYLLV